MAKPFYDDRHKLQALFPCALKAGITLHKSAAFDVCQSRNEDSFFNDWLSIKHNIITRWVDLTDAPGDFGFALLSDHTTSYAFGPTDPLGLVLAYAGKGLWNRTYSLTAPTEVKYTIVPHGGTWDRASVWGEDARWSEPMLAETMSGRRAGPAPARSLVRTSPGTYVTTMFLDGPALVVRLFNAEGDGREQAISFGFVPSDVRLVELDGRHIASLGVVRGRPGEATVKLSLPRFGIRTLRLGGIAKP
jgi:alpha-mannosidase